MASPDCVGMHLADLGAEVVKIEDPSREGGDYIRYAGMDAGETSPNHAHWNRGKLSVALDLRNPEGVRTFLELVAVSDAVVEGLRSGSLERRGLGFSTLKATNARIVLVSVSGFGDSGPYRDLASHGFGFDAWAGLVHPEPDDQERPSMPPHTHVG